MTSTRIGRLFSLAYTKPLSTLGAPLAGALMYFYQSGAFTTQQTVYADAELQTPLTQPITADANGRFAPVFMNPALQYSWQLFNAASGLLESADPVNTQDTSIPVSLVEAVNTSRASTTTLTADPYLTYAIPAAGTYRVEIDLQLTALAAGATPGLAFQVNFSGTVNGSAGNAFALVGGFDSVALTASQSSMALGSTMDVSLGTTPISNTVRIAGTIQLTSAGALAVEWAQSVSSTNTTTMLQGSSMTVTRVG